MISYLRAVLAGVRGGLSAPSVIERRLQSLINPGDVASPRGDGDSMAARRYAALTVRVLSRVSGSRWRNTCLYRSGAECIALRELGMPARLVLGVARGEADGNDAAISAHAWVETGPPAGHRHEWTRLTHRSLTG